LKLDFKYTKYTGAKAAIIGNFVAIKVFFFNSLDLDSRFKSFVNGSFGSVLNPRKYIFKRGGVAVRGVVHRWANEAIAYRCRIKVVA
jgi:hypothetical protein